jgi:hypothetical protein
LGSVWYLYVRRATGRIVNRLPPPQSSPEFCEGTKQPYLRDNRARDCHQDHEQRNSIPHRAIIRSNRNASPRHPSTHTICLMTVSTLYSRCGCSAYRRSLRRPWMIVWSCPSTALSCCMPFDVRQRLINSHCDYVAKHTFLFLAE